MLGGLYILSLLNDYFSQASMDSHRKLVALSCPKWFAPAKTAHSWPTHTKDFLKLDEQCILFYQKNAWREIFLQSLFLVLEKTKKAKKLKTHKNTNNPHRLLHRMMQKSILFWRTVLSRFSGLWLERNPWYLFPNAVFSEAKYSSSLVSELSIET